MKTRVLNVTLLDTWHVGSGKGRGHHLDAVVDRDADGLPYVPGRMLKGLLRDAAECLCAWGHLSRDDVQSLFGGLTPLAEQPGRSHSIAGQLAVSDARLPVAERDYLLSPEGAALQHGLFLSSYQTAVDYASGTAKEGSLRGVELVVPLSLQAELAVAEPGPGWALIDKILPLVHAVGAHKTRGHGRVALTWGEEVAA